jgi:hypothetical protein
LGLLIPEPKATVIASFSGHEFNERSFKAPMASPLTGTVLRT